MNAEKKKNIEDRDVVPVKCSICGKVWLYPLWQARQFNINNQFKCSYCNFELQKLEDL